MDGVPGGAGPPNVNLGPPDISETTRARKLNLKISLDMIKYPIGYKNYYIIRYNTRAAVTLSFDKCLYLRGRLRLTIARRLSAYMSSRALATTTTSSMKIMIFCHEYFITCNSVNLFFSIGEIMSDNVLS